MVLDRNALYLTPTGRHCRWVPLTAREPWAAFVYVRAGQALQAGFCLSPANFHILRKVGG